MYPCVDNTAPFCLDGSVNDEGERTTVETQSGGFEQSVEQHLKHRHEQFEAPNSKTVLDSLDELHRGARKLARNFADNKIVEWIPIVSPLIHASLDMEQASAALIQGKDVDTGKDLTLSERAEVAVSKYGNALWEEAKAGVDVAFMAVGGTIVEKIGLEGAGFIVKKGAEIVAHEAIKKGGDRIVYGKDGRKVTIPAGDPKMQAAEYVVDGMPGMYETAAGMTKDSETKKLLNDASSTFDTLTRNPNTRAALAASLARSEHMDTMMSKMTEYKSNPEAMKNFKI